MREANVEYAGAVYVFKVRSLSFREKAQIEEASLSLERRGRSVTPKIDVLGQRIAKLKAVVKGVPEGFPLPLTDEFFHEAPGDFVEAMAKAFGLSEDEEEVDVRGESRGGSPAELLSPASGISSSSSPSDATST